MSFLDRLIRRFYRPVSVPIKLIFIDIDYLSYSVASVLQADSGCQIISFIDEEPWNHLTEMIGAKLHYPSELISLCEKYGVDAVICFEGMVWSMDDQTAKRLKNLKACVITVAEGTSEDQALKQVKMEFDTI
jgi:hypothetical protein